MSGRPGFPEPAPGAMQKAGVNWELIQLFRTENLWFGTPGADVKHAPV